MIAAKETIYNGYRFRSRLEARWAVFFDTLGVQYQYEPQDHVLADGTRYLPDFYLPAQEMWAEIKGVWPSDAECHKAGLLTAATQQRTYLFAGTPWYGEFDTIVFLVGASAFSPVYAAWVGAYGLWVCGCGVLLPSYKLGVEGTEDGKLERLYCGRCKQVSRVKDAQSMAAYTAARQARFEFGETPQLIPRPDVLSLRWQTLLTALASTNPGLARVLRNAKEVAADDRYLVLTFPPLHTISCMVADRPNNRALVETLTAQWLGKEYTFKACVTP